MKGIFQESKKRLGKLKRVAIRTNHASWYVRQLHPPLTQETGPSSSSGLEVVVDDFNNLARWLAEQAALYPWIYNRRELDYADQYGHLYATIHCQGTIAGYVKVALRQAYIEDYEDLLPLEKDEAFIYDTFTLPIYQKQHLASTLLGEVFKHLRKMDIALVYCHIPEWNKASQALYRKLGFRKIAHVRYLRIMKWTYFSNNPAAVKALGRASSGTRNACARAVWPVNLGSPGRL